MFIVFNMPGRWTLTLYVCRDSGEAELQLQSPFSCLRMYGVRTDTVFSFIPKISKKDH